MGLTKLCNAGCKDGNNIGAGEGVGELFGFRRLPFEGADFFLDDLLGHGCRDRWTHTASVHFLHHQIGILLSVLQPNNPISVHTNATVPMTRDFYQQPVVAAMPLFLSPIRARDDIHKCQGFARP